MTCSRPQGRLHHTRVTNISGVLIHRLSPGEHTGGFGAPANTRPQSYPQGVDETDEAAMNGWSLAGNKTTGLFTTLWTQLRCYRDWLRIRLVSSVTWL